MSQYQEQGKLIRAPQSLAVLGQDLFGDKVNLYTGSLEFVQTDVSLTGNNALPVSIGRRLVTGTQATDGTPFGRWDMDIPHLHGIFATAGWATGIGGSPGLRCTNFAAPPDALGEHVNNPAIFKATEFWHGNFIYVPGQGDQEMLKRGFGNAIAPGGDAAKYPVVTRNNWQFSCLPAMAYGGGGEGFLALAPDGSTYRFDWMVSRSLLKMSKSNPAPDPGVLAPARSADAIIIGDPQPRPNSLPADMNQLRRSEIWILPTRVTDRYGNSVTYTYNPAPENRWQLLSITSSDADGGSRALSFTYQSPSSRLVASVTDGVRTWRYNYNGTSSTAELTSVILPDNSSWQLAGIYPLLKNIEYWDGGGCEEGGNFDPTVLSGFMVHPSGARGDFTLTPTRHGRSGVQNDCYTDAATMAKTAKYPRTTDNYALTNKQISGPGLSPMAWTTTYPPAESSWAPCNGCVSSKTVEVTDPEGHRTRHTFGTLFHETEGMLQKTEVVDRNGTLLRTTTVEYAEPVPPRGVSDQARGDGVLAARVKETGRKTIEQQGVSFAWQANAFNAYAQATNVTRSSSLGSSRTETRYHNNTTKWVLGQIEQVTETTTGRVPTLNGYNQNTANLERVTKFGQLEQTFEYYPDGNLYKRKDGKGQATTYSNYKRGIPRKVQYADQTTESATVDDIGLVRAVTNQAGYTTAYEYDAMGWLSTITYPTQDTVAWTPTSILYTRVPNDEFGLQAGHWRQDVNTGNAASSTYYDALSRPVYTERWDRADRNGTNRAVRYWYDSAGRKTFESYPARNYDLAAEGGVHQEYDGLGRPTVTSTISELGTLYSGYSYIDGFRKVYSDARHHSYTYAYQAFDEPVDSAITAIALPEGVNVSINRDVFGKPLSITHSGGGKSATRSYVYDSAQRLCKTIEPETRSTVQDYDAAGNVVWRAPGLALPSTLNCDTLSIPAARKISYRYDALNRLVSTTFGDASPAITRDYTADGLPNTIKSDGAKWTNTYNKRRLNEQEKLSYGGVDYTFDRRYDAHASLLRARYPQDSVWMEYSPNALGEARQVGSYATAVTYAPNGAITSFRYGNGILHQMTPNRRGLPEWSEDTGLLKDKYEYDVNGNVTAIADWLEGITNRGMSYDDLDRLLSVNSTQVWGDASYTYDALDNLTSSRLTAGANARYLTHTYDPATNLLKAVTNSGGSAYNYSFLYDDFGNVKQRGSQQFVFDLGNRLRRAPIKGTYAYDGLGHRVSVVGPDGVNRIQVYSQEGQLLFVKASNALTGTKYIHLHNHVVAEVTGSSVQYDHTDGLGSPVARTDGAGKLISRTRYEPYGATAAGEAPGIGFAGHVNAADLGLVYMQQRYYDPVAGRFLSIDAVTTDANTGSSFNRYVYANNSPYRYIDPDGRYSEVVWNAAGTAVTVRVPFAVADPSGVARFTPAAVAAQVHSRLSGNVVINGVNVRVNAVGVQVPLNSAAVVHGQANVVTVRPALARSYTSEIGGNQISVRGTADAPVVVHELAHSAKAGDQYPGGVSADGKMIPSTVKATTGTIMGDGTGGANAQTLREMVGPPPPPPQKASNWD